MPDEILEKEKNICPQSQTVSLALLLVFNRSQSNLLEKCRVKSEKKIFVAYQCPGYPGCKLRLFRSRTNILRATSEALSQYEKGKCSTP